MEEEKTKPKMRFPGGFKPDSATLAAGRYGTYEMIQIWGPEKTFDYSLKVQGQASKTLSRLHSDIVPSNLAEEIYEKANILHVDPDRIRELEEKGSHDVIAINTALEEKLSPEARPHVNKARTSADTTETAKALQLKSSLEVIADSVENLRDIVIEKSLEWKDISHMDSTHLYDALPSVSGRAFAHYAEMLQSGLSVLKFFYENSIVGKWGDATGNHHSAIALGISGIELQQEYCRDLGIGFMDAPAQTPGLEFNADIAFAIARIGETMNNIAKYVSNGRSDDVNIFINQEPKRKKGSSAMPHKDAKNGNPDVEEQAMSNRNYLVGNLVTAMMNCEFPYARNLSASANNRINLEDGFKFLDHNIRRLANTVYWLGLNEERSKERVLRSYGVVTSQLFMTYLTDSRVTTNTMARSEAHDLMGKLSTQAWETKTPFYQVLLASPEVACRLTPEFIKSKADPLNYIGESKEIINTVARKYHGVKTLEVELKK